MFAIDNYDFKGKRAIIRVDFNVPLNEKGEVTDDTRIRAAIPTIKKVLEKGGSVILMSHLGRPKKNPDPKFSLEQIVPAIEKRLGVKVMFAGDCMGEKAAEMAKNLKPGEVMLLENLRFYAEEEGKPRGLAEDASKEEKDAAKKALKEGPQKEFVKKLASLADCYINDAFGTAHRKHASTYLIAKQFPNDKMFGYLMEMEFVLLNGEKHPVSLDVTDAIRVTQGATHKIIHIEVEIELPEVIGNGDGAFDPDLEEWEDIDVDIPM